MTSETVQFTQLPQPATFEDYDRAVEEVKVLCERSGVVRALYQIGNVSVPGLSDIDLILVFDEEAARKRRRIPRVEHLSPAARRLFLHDFFYTDPQSFANLNRITIASELRHVWGDDLGQPADVSCEIRLLILTDVLVALLPRAFLLPLVEGRAPARTLIAQIHALRHTLAIMEDLRCQPRPAWADFVEEFRRFRSRWFEYDAPPLAQLTEFLQRAVEMGFTMVCDWGRHIGRSALGEAAWSGNPGPEDILDCGWPRPTLYTRDWSAERAARLTRQAWTKGRCRLVALPLPLATPLLHYRRVGGLHSEHIACRLAVNATLPDLTPHEAARERIEAMDRHVGFLSDIRAGTGQMFFLGILPRGRRGLREARSWLMRARTDRSVRRAFAWWEEAGKALE